jgi:exonuclease III
VIKRGTLVKEIRKLMASFNDFIGRFHLRELFISGAKFTWSNKQKHLVMVKLDRILATDDWEDRFPKCFAWSKARVGSNHCPLILDSGEQGNPRPKYFFSKSSGYTVMVSTN